MRATSAPETQTFPVAHLAAALAWPTRVGGLVPYSVFVDATEEEGVEYVTVEPPFADGVGFHVVHDEDGVVILWDLERKSARATDLLDAMQQIMPLSASDLAAVRASATGQPGMV